MARKRKAGGAPFGDAQQKRSRNKGVGLTFNSFEDAADSEDEFHTHRDKILLEEAPLRKRQRQALEDGETFRGKSRHRVETHMGPIRSILGTF